MSQIEPRHQINWDWRAAGNFICGGSGSGLVILAAELGEGGWAKEGRKMGKGGAEQGK